MVLLFSPINLLLSVLLEVPLSEIIILRIKDIGTYFEVETN